MGVGVVTREWLNYISRVGRGCGYTAPSATSFYVGLLTTGLSLTAASTASNAASGEVADANGYARQLLGRQITGLSSNTLTTAATHGLSNGDRIHIVSTGSLYTGLSAATEYFVIGATATTLQVSATNGGAAIALSGGSGTPYIRMSPVFDTGGDNRSEAIFDQVVFTSSGDITYQGWFLMANTTGTRGDSSGSILVGYEYYGSSQVLPNGDPRELRIRFYLSDRGAAVGATS